MKELWKDIKGYEGLYQVSNLGNVRSLDRVIHCIDGTNRMYKGCIMKTTISINGYLNVSLKHSKNYLVHRLVAQAFIPNIDNLPCVNHIDENKENNNVNNLEWCTISYNNKYGNGFIERCINARKGSILKTAKQVLQYSLDGKFIKEYYSAMEAARQNNCRQGGISECCNGKQKTAYGYVWKYKEL